MQRLLVVEKAEERKQAHDDTEQNKYAGDEIPVDLPPALGTDIRSLDRFPELQGASGGTMRRNLSLNSAFPQEGHSQESSALERDSSSVTLENGELVPVRQDLRLQRGSCPETSGSARREVISVRHA